MNILHLISSSGFFGAENVLYQLVSELKRFHSVQSIVGVFNNLTDPHLELAEICDKEDIERKVFRCRGKVDLATIVRLRNFIQNREIELVHSHGYKSNIYAYFATFGTKARRMATCHNWIINERKLKWYGVLDRLFLRYFDQIIAVSRDVKNLMTNSGISDRKICIIENGVSLDKFASDMAARNRIAEDIGIKSNTNVVGTVGRLSEEKGQKHLLQVIRKLKERYPELFLLLVGDGPLRMALQKEFDSDFIRFVGNQKEVHHYYAMMDIFVLPSLTEGLPMALLEAMASELPVIATDVGEIPRVLSDGETGIIVEPKDENSLEDSLCYLLSHKDIALEMGKKGCERVRKDFSSEKMANKYMKVYKKLIHRADCQDYIDNEK